MVVAVVGMMLYYCNCDSSRNYYYDHVRGFDDGDAGDDDDDSDNDGEGIDDAVAHFRHPLHWN